MTFPKYPKIKQLGTKETLELTKNNDDVVFIQEKIDGANFRFMPTEDGRIIFGSRTQSIGDSQSDIGGNWKRCAEYILECTKGKIPAYTTYPIFYGECSIRHSIDYNWDKMPPFIGFDVMFDDYFIDPDLARMEFERIGLPFVHEVWHGTVDEMPMIEEAFIPKSVYGETKAEGVVIKNYNTQTFGKFVSQKFKEVNKDTFGKGKRQATNDEERLVSMYCTNPRIDKHIFKLINEGHELDMPLMQYLPVNVWTDIVDECGQDILNQKWTLDLRDVRKKVSKRCVSVLQQVITNQYLKGVE